MFSQELEQKDPRGESEALAEPEEAALPGLTGDSRWPDLWTWSFTSFFFFKYKHETPEVAAKTMWCFYSAF